jgi:hypothetical protein
MSTRNATLDWEFFFIDPDPASSPPRVPLRLHLYAAARTAQALRIYRKHGWGAAHRYLHELRPGPGFTAYAALSPDAAVRLAWREVFTCQLVARALAPNALCMPRSFAPSRWPPTCPPLGCPPRSRLPERSRQRFQ